MSIKQKIILAISAAVIIALAGVTLTVSLKMRTAFVRNFQVSSEAQLGRMESFVDLFFDTSIAVVDLVADSALVRNGVLLAPSYAEADKPTPAGSRQMTGTEEEIYLYLQSLIDHYPAYDLVYIGGKNSSFVFAPLSDLPARYDPVKFDWYKTAIRAGKAVVTPAYLSNSGETVCTVVAPVVAPSGNGYDGVIGLDISLSTLTEATASVPVGKTGYVIMIDDQGRVVSDPKNSGPDVPQEARWLGQTLDKLPPDVSKALSALVKIKDGMSDEIRFQNKDWLAGVQTTKSGWALIMLQERDEVFADAMGVTWGIVGVGLVIMLLMIILAWVIARSMSRPIARLANAAQQVAEGDLQAIPQDASLFKGEMGILHRSLLTMVSKLGELIETANNKMKEAEEALGLSKKSLLEAEEAKAAGELARRQGVLETAEQIGAIIGELAQSVHKLADESRETERRAGAQQELVSGTAEAINEMTVVVNEVAASTSRTASLADEAMDQVKNGHRLVFDMVSNMSRIEEQSREMRNGLEDLGEKASGIGTIINVINDIADQTNLLALNAAIEAARAGEAGRGFAVVADEVRKLAEKTMEATKQVGESINSMQESTKYNVSAIQQSADFISTSTEVAQQAGEALNKIEHMVDNTASEVRSIATASEEQSATTEEMSRRTNEVASLTHEVAAGAQHSNEAVQHIMAVSTRLEDIVRRLREDDTAQ